LNFIGQFNFLYKNRFLNELSNSWFIITIGVFFFFDIYVLPSYTIIVKEINKTGLIGKIMNGLGR